MIVSIRHFFLKLHDWFDDFQTEIRTCTSIHGCTGALWLQVSARSWRWELEDSDTETKSSPLGRTAGNSLPSLQNKWHQPKPAAPKSLREKKKREKISLWWSKHLYYYYCSQLISENKLHPQYWTTLCNPHCATNMNDASYGSTSRHKPWGMSSTFLRRLSK